MKDKAVVILGPTATGKSRCGIALARQLPVEIISGDSMLVYKKMNIGTAKPSAAELQAVPHYLVDILPPSAEYSVVDFQKQAGELISALNRRGKVPLIVGGTGLYIKALLEGYAFNEIGEDSAQRSRWIEFARRHGNEALHEKLQNLAPQAAARLHRNDTQRIIRALEIAAGGVVPEQKKALAAPYDATVFGLRMERQLLYRRINERVEQMVAQGLFEETEQLLAAGVSTDAPAMRGIGYRQAVWYLSGQMTKPAAVEKIKQATRNFAKRQLTWYRQMPYIIWFDLTPTVNYEELAKIMRQTLVEKLKIG